MYCSPVWTVLAQLDLPNPAVSAFLYAYRTENTVKTKEPLTESFLIRFRKLPAMFCSQNANFFPTPFEHFCFCKLQSLVLFFPITEKPAVEDAEGCDKKRLLEIKTYVV